MSPFSAPDSWTLIESSFSLAALIASNTFFNSAANKNGNELGTVQYVYLVSDCSELLSPIVLL